MAPLFPDFLENADSYDAAVTRTLRPAALREETLAEHRARMLVALGVYRSEVVVDEFARGGALGALFVRLRTRERCLPARR
jgi:hypothetical protein